MKYSELIKNYAVKISGGKGDKSKPEDFDKKELIVGIYVEREHTSDPKTAIEISIDHLSENPKYYTDLVNSGIVDEKKAIEAAKRFGMIKDESIKEIIRLLVRKELNK